MFNTNSSKVTLFVKVLVLLSSALQAIEIEDYNKGIEGNRNRKGLDLIRVVEHDEQNTDDAVLSPTGFMKINENRLTVMKRTCEVARKDPEFFQEVMKKDSGIHLTLPKRNLTYCLVAKAASSSWCVNLIKLSGKEFNEKSRDAKKYAVHGIPSEEVLNSESLVSLVVVRNPFTRLVSGFRDKMESHGGWRLLKKSIVQKYRSRAIKELGAEFFEGPNFGAILPVPPPAVRSANDPTFWEFVKHLIDKDPADYNTHWRPIYISCKLCTNTYKYNYILKVETRSYEEPVLARLMNWTELEEESRTVRNWNAVQNLTSEEVARKYFEHISLEDKLALYKKYEYDFELFGYKPDPEILVL